MLDYNTSWLLALSEIINLFEQWGFTNYLNYILNFIKKVSINIYINNYLTSHTYFDYIIANCISALAERSSSEDKSNILRSPSVRKSIKVKYRDSKLTHLLKGILL